MRMLTVPVRSYAEMRERAAAFLREWAPRGEVLVLAPTRAAADDLVRSVCERAVIGVHRFTLRDYAIAASSRALNERGLAPVRRIAREALAALITARARAELQYYGPVAQYPGFPRALARTLDELRLNRRSPDALRELGPRGDDLARLLELYEAELAGRDLSDHAARLRFAIGAGDPMPLLLVDVQPRVQLERELLEDLASRAPASLALGLGTGVSTPATCLESLATFVLTGQQVPVREPDDSFAVFSASGEALECVEIARRVLQTARAGIPFDEIAVLLRSPERHRPLLGEALRRAAIPAYFTRGARNPDPAGRAFLALLRCAGENLSAVRFAEYLSLNQVPSEEGELRVPVRWERMLVDAAVAGGRDRWERRLNGLRARASADYDAAATGGERERIARRIGDIESLAGFALPLLDRLEHLPDAADWGEWLEALWELASRSLREPETVHELLDELAPMAGIGPVSLAGVIGVLEEWLCTTAAPPAGQRYGQVFVGSIEEAAGMTFRAVFVPGLNEGIFPRPPSDDPLLPGQPRDQEDATLLRTACACASERIVMSWSRLDLLTGRARVPSFYAFEALKAARGSEVDVHALISEALGGTETRIGWPAPVSPAEAIDDLEFDLSYVRPAWDNRTAGEAAYLKQLSGHATRSLRARWIRWRKKDWQWPDGLVDLDIHALQVLERKRPAHRAWSPSVLEEYARCPYRFALRGIFGLRPAEQPEPVQRIDPVTRGRIFHRVQFKLLREGHQDIATALEALARIVNEVAAEYQERLAPAVQQVWDAGIDSLHADLRGWLAHRFGVDRDWTPIHWEFGFGERPSEERDPATVAEPVEVFTGIKLRGSIDMIERNSGGSVRVVDHKTGRYPEKPVYTVGGGEHLQPVLYALAAEAALKLNSVATGRYFYATLRQGYRTIDIRIDPNTRRNAEHVLRCIDEALHEGFFPAAPREKACKHCDYLPVCGPWEEERSKKKHKLTTLEHIRGLQ